LYAKFPDKEVNVKIVTERSSDGGTVCQMIVDSESGELYSRKFIKESDAQNGRPPNSGKQPHFYKLYCTNWQDLVKKKHLNPYEVGVFFMLLSFVGWESNFLVHPKTGANLNCSQLSQMLDIERMQLSDTLALLNKKGLLAVVKCGDGRANHYMLNSNVVFWGSKIKDTAEHSRFVSDCPYEPPVMLRYSERPER